MTRPCCLRHVNHAPAAVYFKPAGVPACLLEQVTLTLDEVEALRLADLQGLYQAPAAEQMKISRPTFTRIIEVARRKVAEALIHGKALRLEGGAVVIKGEHIMANQDGTGPNQQTQQGKGRGLCGCGQRRSQRGQGRGRCRQNPPTAGTATESGKGKSQP